MSNIIYFRAYFYGYFQLVYLLIVKQLHKKSVRLNHVRKTTPQSGESFLVIIIHIICQSLSYSFTYKITIMPFVRY
ncbi:hypothetical protein HanIR_Chr15g0761951 [Helianthus annuus]|nr:hypothetical protein HanIR_Chr15g0761951 [Helianthus annuus]